MADDSQLQMKDNLFSKEELETFRSMLKAEKEKLLHKAKQTVATGTIQLDKDEMFDEVDLASATVE